MVTSEGRQQQWILASLFAVGTWVGIRAGLLVGGLVCGLVCGLALAHPAHVTLSEVGWNAQQSTLEVALRMAPEDLQLALERHQRLADTAATDDSEARIVDLLNTQFRIINAEGHALTLNWVGWESSHQATWLYFEFSGAHAGETLLLGNRLLLGIHEQQLNHVVIQLGEQQASFALHREASERAFTLPRITPQP
jgi:hypothetical protein